MSGFPVIAEKFIEPANGMGADAVKHVPDVGEGTHLESFACSGETADDRSGLPPPSLMKNRAGPRPNGEVGMRPARHFGQLGLDTPPRSGIVNAG